MRKQGKKRMLAIMMAAAMAASAVGSMTAFASEFSVNIVDKNGNGLSAEEIERIFGAEPTFTAYRVFDGEDVEHKLVNPVWNAAFEGLNSDATLVSWLTTEEAAAGATTITADQVAVHLQANPADAEVFAGIVKSYVEAKQLAGTTLTVGNKNDLDAGYYLIVNAKKDGESTAVENPVLMEVTSDGEFNITVKTDRPNVEKKIWEENRGGLADAKVEYVPGEGSIVNKQWNDVADFDIGDSVPFKLTAKIPAGTTTGYDKYMIRFEDTVDSNLELSADVAEYQVFYKYDGDYYTYTVSGNDLDVSENGFTLRIDDIKSFTDFDENKDLEVYVMFTAKLQSGTVAADGEENKVKLHFTNNSESTGEGTTEEDVVVALTFDTVIDKWADVNGTHTSLDGVEFKLYQVNGTVPADLATVKDANSSYDLSDEAKAAANLTEVKFTKDGDRYVVDPNGNAVFTTTGSDFAVHGLDRSTYILVETKAKDGYNILKKAIKVDLYNTTKYLEDGYTSGAYQDPNQVAYVVSVDGLNPNGNLVSVENKSGSLLPETGGTGTMLLYLAGTALMAGGVFFLTSRRKKENEN